MSDPLPHAHGEPVLDAKYRAAPEDFIVDEIDGFEATGSGEHLLLTIEKRGMNTLFAAKQIAAWAGVAEVAIGYAGLKDRHAVTRQRISVHLPKRVAPDIASLQSDALRVLKSEWHAKKLPRGALAGNRFVLTLRDVQGERGVIEQRLQAIGERGVPNYFGEQRFGRDGDNISNALAMFNGRRMRREQRTMLLSAARSGLFNRVLASRVAHGSWDRGLEGEVWLLDGSRSVFGPEPWSETLAQRLAAFDIHPSGALWGAGELRTQDAAHGVELAAMSDEQSLQLRSGLEAAGLKQERRALRLRPNVMTHRWLQEDLLEISFDLPPGTYATVVLRELGEMTNANATGPL